MIDSAALRRTITEKLTRVQDLGNNIFRGERIYQGKTFATAYIDLSDNIIQRAANLAKFQEGLLGSEFFTADGDQRWNSYLYFWAGPDSQNDESFLKAKARIEGDRHFARKFVLTEEDLLERFEDVSIRKHSAQVATDASVQWEEILRTAALSILLEKRPRTQLIELIGTGEAFAVDTVPVARALPNPLSDPLSTGLLRSFRVGKFRAALTDKQFQFGDVNLIFGPNGVGKTSLLESIEALYCGRVRHDREATFENIEADVFTPAGEVVTVKSTAVPAIIRARNLAWYGQSNQNAGAISQSFTRFNFLDTDAAFRLSGESTPDQLKKDLSLLLVGAETSSLWTDLCKLRDDAMSKRTSFSERIPSLQKQTELLGNEVKRLQDSPTETTAFRKSYRASLHELGCSWAQDGGNEALAPSDRSRLESLSRGLRQAIALAQGTPAKITMLRQQAQSLLAALDKIRNLVEADTSKRQELREHEAQIEAFQPMLSDLGVWSIYCEADAPALAKSIEQAKLATSNARIALSGISLDDVHEVPAEYAIRGLSAAFQIASESLALAEQQEKSASDSLAQQERIGQSLTALRSDLRGLAQAIIDRTGDTLHCPVCATPHLDGELLHKIEALTATDNAGLSNGLHQAAQVARDRAQRERDALATLQVLQRFAEANDVKNSATVRETHQRLILKHRELIDAMSELERLESATHSLGQYGADWAGYPNAEAAAFKLLGAEEDLSNLQVVNSRIAAIRKDAEAADKAASEARESLAVTNSEVNAIALSVGLPADGASPKDMDITIQRAMGTHDTVLDFLGEASRVITLADDQPLEPILQAIDDTINAFDRAQHAEKSEINARSELNARAEELQESTAQLSAASDRKENLTKAIDVLSEIVEMHSLEKATQEALESIRGHVSEIFSRIHSPAEYTLGDFHGDHLLITRDGLRTHGAAQVSTGQRAALALSIFLAMNRSADSAPPVLLIDDPIAHIDDLNALSFLDYLRDLAVSTRKQIFFATADARLAALFQRKFEFLGSERFKKIVLAR
ncbi:chromosome segregation protein [Pseudomonas sp. 478]|uniref:AAA family ATPase n=1 Tax=unclassified Pseudomonas TaxID=196821 RepID=UPI000DAF3F0D|nr:MULTISPECIES: AAA family ATPase [unclassified Pseudomonas]PZW98148.1 chromosome segregation protein [Pseudomonas sp. 478]TCV56634.1 chromosome segregation protein [Pseudomonas sp. 460]